MDLNLSLKPEKTVSKVIYALGSTKYSNRELCMLVYGQVEQNHRSNINQTLKRLESLQIVEKDEKYWKLSNINGKYALKIVRNLWK